MRFLTFASVSICLNRLAVDASVNANRRILDELEKVTAKADSTPEELMQMATFVSSSPEYKDFIRTEATAVTSNVHSLLKTVNKESAAVVASVATTTDSGAPPAANANLRSYAVVSSGDTAASSAAVSLGANGATADEDEMMIFEFVASTISTIKKLRAAIEDADDDVDAGNYQEAIVTLSTEFAPVLSQLTNAVLTHVPNKGTAGKWREALIKMNNLVLQYIETKPGPDSWVGFKKQMVDLLDGLLHFPSYLNGQLSSSFPVLKPGMTNAELRSAAIVASVQVCCTCSWSIFRYARSGRSHTTTIEPPAVEDPTPGTELVVAAPEVDARLQKAINLALFIKKTSRSLMSLLKEVKAVRHDKKAWENLELRIIIQLLELVNSAAANDDFVRVYHVLRTGSHDISKYLLDIFQDTSIDEMQAAVENFIERIQTSIEEACPDV
jgi:hypothetical protein